MPLPAYEILGTYLRGDTRKMLIPCVNPDTTPADLTGAKVWMTFKTDVVMDDNIAPGFQLSTTTSGVEIEGLPEDGVIRVTIEPANTSGLTAATTFYWDVQVLDGDGNTWTAVQGEITFEPDITRAVS